MDSIFVRVRRVAKRQGVKGVFRKMLEKLHLKPGKNDLLLNYHYLVDTKKIPFNHKQYEKKKDVEKKLLNWVIPEMGEGSGGHINIFRFISNLEDMDFHSRIYLFQSENYKNNDAKLREFVREKFAILDTRVEVYGDVEEMTFAHGTLATSWETAYYVRNFDNTISKFYFVQDYEPYFFANGSFYQFAENTYRFGFRGITAGDWLKDKLAQEYGMRTESFGFSYDKDLYHKMKKHDKVKRVFFYARPVTPRRDFELGVLALNELCKRMPEVEIVFAGWNVDVFVFPFKHKNLKVVPIEALSKIYAQCDMCLVLSNTNLSLLPLEIMASNSAVVCSRGKNSEWLVNEENAVLVDYDPIKIADTLEYYLKHEDELAVIRNKGLKFAEKTSWVAEAEKVRDALMKGITEDEQDI